MNVTRGHGHIAVSCDSRQRPRVAARLTQARKERMAEAVKHEWADWLYVILTGLFCQRLERPRVLFAAKD